MKRTVWIVLFLVFFLAVAACTAVPESTGVPDSKDSEAAADPSATVEPTDSDSSSGGEDADGLANPASLNCVEQGGELEIRDEEGGQAGYCIFPDSSECEEWAYFRGECVPGTADQVSLPNPASVNCIEQGGRLLMKTRGDGGVIGVCYFEDNRHCEEWALLRGDCPVGGRKITGYLTVAARYCAIAGGEYTITDESGAPEDEQGTCTLPNGAVCDVWDYYNGQCVSETAEPDQDRTYRPLDDAACAELARAVQDALGLEVTTGEAPFEDTLSGESGTGCQASAVGTGADFGTLPEAAAALSSVLQAQGWEEDPQYQADGPTGKASAFRQGDVLCLSHIAWQPAEGTDCPPDEPITSCELTPEQQLYLATLTCAQP